MAKKEIRLRCPFCGQNKKFVCVSCKKIISSYYVENKPKQMTNKQRAYGRLIAYVAQKYEEISEMED